MDFTLHPWQRYFLILVGWVRRQQIQFAWAHSALYNLLPCQDGDPPEWDILSIRSAEVVREERLGGVVKSFVRRAA